MKVWSSQFNFTVDKNILKDTFMKVWKSQFNLPEKKIKQNYVLRNVEWSKIKGISAPKHEKQFKWNFDYRQKYSLKNCHYLRYMKGILAPDAEMNFNFKHFYKHNKKPSDAQGINIIQLWINPIYY